MSLSYEYNQQDILKKILFDKMGNKFIRFLIYKFVESDASTCQIFACFGIVQSEHLSITWCHITRMAVMEINR